MSKICLNNVILKVDNFETYSLQLVATEELKESLSNYHNNQLFHLVISKFFPANRMSSKKESQSNTSLF